MDVVKIPFFLAYFRLFPFLEFQMANFFVVKIPKSKFLAS